MKENGEMVNSLAKVRKKLLVWVIDSNIVEWFNR